MDSREAFPGSVHYLKRQLTDELLAQGIPMETLTGFGGNGRMYDDETRRSFADPVLGDLVDIE